MKCPFWDDQLYVRIVQLPLGFPPTIMTVVPGGPNFGEGSRSCFLMAPFTIWNPLNHVERKSITSYDETRIVDQRVHVLWQFNVDKPTKTYKNRLQHGRTWIILATEKPFRGAPACSSTTLHSWKICQVPLSPTKATLETDTTATGGHLKGKKWHFVTKKWPIESRVTQETHSETLGLYHSLSFAEGTPPLPHRLVKKSAFYSIFP